VAASAAAGLGVSCAEAIAGTSNAATMSASAQRAKPVRPRESGFSLS